ncbi:PPE family protein [Mycobacterium angelicum]|uniref:PPE family protein n=1 Tax=Mycobacterium angelicum TaxID=470074 RepID=A0A1X0A734_MYCAN|nr:PPE family protein [Mycobacterium angelicum]MCV7195071.1 PPE domain-containing protein [Mycobacterium angelicum]ORA25889.1 PPE family protein [Mycobacterium angelicum]
MDFAVLPPEINSGRMYLGPGSGPLVAAAAAWEALAAELSSTANSYRGVIAELTGGPWVGPSSTSMTAAAIPYMSWMDSTAAQAEQTAGQLGSAAAAYEAAFAATVPPSEIEVNRALLVALVATNIFGQNTPAITATEAQYAEMWAQDAAAMYGYAGASAAATTLTPFTSPPQSTNQTGSATQAAAVSQAAAQGGTAQSTLAQLAAVPNLLQGLASGGSFDPIAWLHNFATSPLGMAINKFGSDAGNVATEFSGFAFVASGITPFFVSLYPLALPPSAAAVVSDVTGDGLGSALVGYGSDGSAGVAAGVGEAATVGKLSVPQSWVSSPAIRLAATALPSAGAEALPQTEAGGPGGFYGIPPMGSLINAPRGGETPARSRPRSKVLPPWAAGTEIDEPTQGRSPQPQRATQHVASALSERERDELAALRKEIAELATERDAAARLIKEAML